MNDVVLIAHVVAAILLLGPVTVAISMFPRLALAARDGEAGTVGAARTMHATTHTSSWTPSASMFRAMSSRATGSMSTASTRAPARASPAGRTRTTTRTSFGCSPRWTRFPW